MDDKSAPSGTSVRGNNHLWKFTLKYVNEERMMDVHKNHPEVITL
jgi:hypothetical protein